MAGASRAAAWRLWSAAGGKAAGPTFALRLEFWVPHVSRFSWFKHHLLTMPGLDGLVGLRDTSGASKWFHSVGLEGEGPEACFFPAQGRRKPRWATKHLERGLKLLVGW